MKRVSLLIETSNQSGRDILMGVGQYAEERNNWEIAHHPGDIGSPWEKWLKEWVALVSVDNDEVQTRLLRPPLSSIDANHSQIGYDAARLLGRMMKQKNWRKIADTLLEIPPNSVKIRQSSNTFATPDPVTARAIGFIQQHACEKIDNDLVARAAGASRSVLQRKFRDQLGKTIHRVISEERLNRARRLLEDSDVPLIEIAEICGYDSQQSLNRACAREWNQTPRQIRGS